MSIPSKRRTAAHSRKERGQLGAMAERHIAAAVDAMARYDASVNPKGDAIRGFLEIYRVMRENLESRESILRGIPTVRS